PKLALQCQDSRAIGTTVLDCGIVAPHVFEGWHYGAILPRKWHHGTKKWRCGAMVVAPAPSS
ncbi:hypothetical protein PanWU01x14_319610, partial [Parasponia andersonii]